MVEASRSKGDRGIHIIAVYKTVKAAVQIVLAVVLLVAAGERIMAHLQAHLTDLDDHFQSAWSQHLVAWAMRNLTRSHVYLAAGALTADGILTAVEAWALHTRRVWGEWLVVIATGTLIPVEAYEIVAHVRPVRVLVLILNLIVVAYLARRQYCRHLAAKAERLREAVV